MENNYKYKYVIRKILSRSGVKYVPLIYSNGWKYLINKNDEYDSRFLVSNKNKRQK